MSVWDDEDRRLTEQADPATNAAFDAMASAARDELEIAGDAGRCDDREPSSWCPVDLTAALEGRDLPAPELLSRTNGSHLLYRGRVHWFQGESESCKSWLAQIAAAQTLEAGERVLWVDFEDDDRGVISRLLALGVAKEAIRDRFVYVRPEEPLRTRDGFTAAKTDLDNLLGQQFALAVIDGVTEALTVEGLSLIDNADIAIWLRLLPKRIADRTGAAVVCIDHLAKNSEGQARYAIGAQHKLAGITGAAYRLEVRKRFRRTDGIAEVEGQIAITVTKDRPGWVRSNATDGDGVGTLQLTSYPDGGISGAIQPAGTTVTPDLKLCRRILDHLDTYQGATGRSIDQAVTGNTHAIRDAVRWMAEDGRRWVRVEPKGMAHLHFLTDVGREEFGI
jgi:hypothetical protein